MDSTKDVRQIAVWHYYTNEEGKPRWKCTHCGKIVVHNVDQKRFCSRCGSEMRRES